MARGATPEPDSECAECDRVIADVLYGQAKHHAGHHQRGVRRPQSASGASSGSAAAGQRRRRYQRVVRNENAPPPDQPDDNPFVVRKFTQVNPSLWSVLSTW